MGAHLVENFNTYPVILRIPGFQNAPHLVGKIHENTMSPGDHYYRSPNITG